MLRIVMLRWWILVTLVCRSRQDGNGQDAGASPCEPRNATLALSKQTLRLTWEDGPSCSAALGALVYEMLVLRDGEDVHEDEVTVTPDAVGSTHHWSWTSDVPLECVSHSVRLRSRHGNRNSTVELQVPLPGVSRLKTIQVYPLDGIFQVGSNVTFCCVVQPGQVFDRMYLTGYDDSSMTTTRIGSHSYALSVHLYRPSGTSCTDVKCFTKASNSGACAYIGYPPDDRDLQCETQDLETVQCQWKVGRSTHLRKSATVYQLNGRPCKSQSEGRCEQDIQAGETKWILTAKNDLGQVELTDFVDVRHRVHMLPPIKVAVSNVNARNVSVGWRWAKEEPYSRLNTTCQVDVSRAGAQATTERSGVGLTRVVVKDLLPNWAHALAVRCGTAQHFWKWSNWSTSLSFRTLGDVPDPLDVWMQMEDHKVLIVWKAPLANQSHGNMADYTVTWARTARKHRPNTTTVSAGEHLLPLSLDPTEEYVVTVTARNQYGSSSPSAVTVPRRSADRVNSSVIAGSDGGFSLSWSDSPKSSCGYIVDWCPTSGPCSVEWLRLQEPKARISSGNFKPGVRYSLSIYACTQGPPALLERRVGYVREERLRDRIFQPLELTQWGSDVEVSWSSVPLPEQTAFIRGYVLYWSEDNGRDNTSFSVSSADPDITKLMAQPLKITSYTFTVRAQTAVGECGTTVFSYTLNPPTDSLIKVVSISLISFFILLSLLTTVCYRHWTCIKRKAYPPIPKPVLTDKWLTSPNDYNCRPLYVGLHLKSEADVTEVPELHCKSGGGVLGHDGPKNEPLFGSQTPKGYYNQSGPPRPPPPVPSAFVGVFPNLTYSLKMQTEGQQSKSEPRAQEEPPLESSCSGYQPQSHAETLPPNPEKEISDSPLYCVSTYILLPQSP